MSVGDPLGWIAIPRLGVRSVIVEGDDDLTLSFAAGHVPGTALPGAPGNAALAGHRDSVFSGLAHVRDGDVVLVTTPSARYRYVVSSTEVVGPDDVSALDAGGGTSLTLITCFPFRYVGPAPRRYVVRARLAPGEVSGEARTPRVNGSS
ncbi:MAG TPA: class D sortase [Thermoanaerobaculaceae bacterium]|nr:class D sortase [Thermoanaerobaculaceae bacterium]